MYNVHNFRPHLRSSSVARRQLKSTKERCKTLQRSFVDLCWPCYEKYNYAHICSKARNNKQYKPDKFNIILLEL